MQTLSEKLFPKEHGHLCRDVNCKQMTVEHDGRWFITFGHAGFNSPTNNGSGYETQNRARSTVRAYASR